MGGSDGRAVEGRIIGTKHAAEVLGTVGVAGAFAFPFWILAALPEVADLSEVSVMDGDDEVVNGRTNFS